MSAAIDMDVLSEADFGRLRNGCRALFGVTIPDEKRPLAEARLRSLGRQLGAPSLTSLVDTLLSGANPELASHVVDALTTNHTYFMREEEHFELLSKDILPQLERSLARTKDLRLWCAAAATGEEPYYLAMLLREHFGAAYSQWNAGLLATDISDKALSVGRRGLYSTQRVAPLTPELRSRYFQPAGPDQVQVKDSLKKDVVFRRFNLMTERYPFRQPFDVVFIRNVLIYFARDEMQHVLERVASVLKPGGWMFIGMAESLRRDDRHFEYVQTGAYRRRGRA